VFHEHGIHVSETVVNSDREKLRSQRRLVKHNARFSCVESAEELGNTVNVGLEKSLHVPPVVMSSNADKLAVSSSRNAVGSDQLSNMRVLLLTQNSDESRASTGR
jgi:hypothetical protein